MSVKPSLSSPSGSSAPTAAHAPVPETAKDTLISIIIAFALAFVFRGFVIEAFVIPTGSMAPTLMGAHMKFRSSESGYEWAVDPWQPGPPQDPSQYPSPQRDVHVNDPMSGEAIRAAQVPLHAGDRILVLKYLYTVAEPQRWDVIVFKNPTEPSINYIKRLIGLPGEEIALVDGDVFVRSAAKAAADASAGNGSLAWAQPGWTIARKPRLSQRSVWQPVYDATFAPLNSQWERTPFTPSDPAGWKVVGQSYQHDKADHTELKFDQSKLRFAEPIRENWTLDDRYPYNQKRQEAARFPDADLRLRAGIEPKAEGLKVEVRLEARRHEFVATISGTTVSLGMRHLVGPAGLRAALKPLATSTIAPLKPGRVYNVEFCHVDQSMQVWIDGTLVAHGEYDWSPAERVEYATGNPLTELITQQNGVFMNVLANNREYQKPEIKWVFEGAPLNMYRSAVDRDLYYQPATYPRLGGPALATSPTRPLVLKADEFFACGDNSPASLDGRLWDTVDPWIAQEFHPPIGIVPRDLLLGRAFFVYWPSLRYNAPMVPVPDFGRMRFIW